MTSLFILLEMTAGAKKMAATDPHGLTLSLIAVCTVFTALVVLYFIYSLIGKAAQRKLTPPAPKLPKLHKTQKASVDEETAAAIAMALDAELGGADKAAIALALHLYFNDRVHDVEPGIITIAPARSAWADKTLTFRKTPRK